MLDDVTKGDLSRQTGALLSGYLVCVVAVVTLAPFEVRWVSDGWSTLLDPTDFGANIFMFVPLGFAFHWAFGRWALWASLVLTFGVETVQWYVPHRHSSPYDLLANTCGAMLGMMIHSRFVSSLDERLAGRLGLDLPLLIPTWLLTPAFWAATLAWPVTRWLPVVVLCGGFALGLLASAWRHRLRYAGVSAQSMVVFAVGWGATTVAPALVREPMWAMVSSGTFGVLMWGALQVRWPIDARGRFEYPTLGRVGWLFGLGLLVSVATGPSGRTVWSIGLGEVAPEEYQRRVFSTLTYVELCVVLGWLLAQAEGRSPEPSRRVVERVCRRAAAICLALEGVAAFASGASVIRLLLGMCGVVIGAVAYRLQTSLIVRSRGANPRRSSGPVDRMTGTVRTTSL